MKDEQGENPLHGVTLEEIIKTLVADYGWKEMGESIAIKCFTSNPSVKSSLKFLRRTPWARKKVEHLYLASKRDLWGHPPAGLSTDPLPIHRNKNGLP